MPRITNGIESENVFLLQCQEYTFHILNCDEQRLAVFKTEECTGYFQGGEVISFDKNKHKGCSVMMEGRDDILTYMKQTLPFDEYAEYERWELKNA